MGASAPYFYGCCMNTNFPNTFFNFDSHSFIFEDIITFDELDYYLSFNLSNFELSVSLINRDSSHSTTPITDNSLIFKIASCVSVFDISLLFFLKHD